ncbi:MAG: metal-sulfur cluster assembly factor [Anaerolineae bacterium]|nr:metal-sulfur cluster assembly factor [Anaerolineae bacterium]
MTEDQILDTLRSVIDPEVGINIVDMGLVYTVEIKPDEVYIQITMTSPTCPLHGVITRNMDKVLRSTFPELGAMTIELVWEPPWTPEQMSLDAKKQLGWN